MLFRTVYGPEITAIYTYLAHANMSVSKKNLYQIFIPIYTSSKTVSTQNIDDALAFLSALSLIHEDDHAYHITPAAPLSPRLLILHQMKRLATGEIEAKHQLDPLYLSILDEIFIKTNRLFAEKMHLEVNKLRRVKELGGLSQEKVQAWRRVMAFLGVGQRVGNGFQCAYSPELLREILQCWDKRNTSLQSFFETHLSTFLPFTTQSHDIAWAVSKPLSYLAEQGEIALESRQDSPSKAYFGIHKFQYITFSGGIV